MAVVRSEHASDDALAFAPHRAHQRRAVEHAHAHQVGAALGGDLAAIAEADGARRIERGQPHGLRQARCRRRSTGSLKTLSIRLAGT